MAAPRPDQAKTGAAGAVIGTPETQVTPRPGRYEIDTSCSAVTFRTRHLQAVRGMSFAVEHGEIFALLGPNGAGKTTLEILEGFRARDAGRVEVLGLDPGDRWHGRALRERIGLVLQEPSSPSAASAGTPDPNNRRSIRR